MEQIVKNHIVARRIKGKVEKLKRLKYTAFPMHLFYKKGVGLETIKSKTGRLTDLKGMFVVFSHRYKPVIVGSSKTVFQEVQNLVRGERKMDRDRLVAVAQHFGFKSWLAGQTYVRNMKVFWVEVTRDIDLKALEYTYNRRKIDLIE